MSSNKSENKSIPKTRVRTNVKAGEGPEPGVRLNHGIRVRTGVKAS